jgi:pimeloyl-ACP methyl ester carboxylesterase
LREIGDLNIHYEMAGDGPPMVLLHGGGSRAQCFEEMMPILSREFTVYAYDLRGAGETQRPPEPRISYEVWRADLSAFLDSFGIGEAILVGWSLGAGVVMDFAVHYPKRVSKLVLIGAVSPRLERAIDPSGFEKRRKLIESGATAKQIVAETFEFTKGAFSPNSIQHKPHAVEAIRHEHLRNDPKEYLETVRMINTPLTVGDRLGEIRCPSLIIVGEHDARTPFPNGADLNKAIPNSFLKVLENCGHFYGYEQLEVTSEVMLSFLRAEWRAVEGAAAG